MTGPQVVSPVRCMTQMPWRPRRDPPPVGVHAHRFTAPCLASFHDRLPLSALHAVSMAVLLRLFCFERGVSTAMDLSCHEISGGKKVCRITGERGRRRVSGSRRVGCPADPSPDGYLAVAVCDGRRLCGVVAPGDHAPLGLPVDHHSLPARELQLVTRGYLRWLPVLGRGRGLRVVSDLARHFATGRG
jgi:hypothetical protein